MWLSRKPNALPGLSSRQLSRVDWHARIMLQCFSRNTYPFDLIFTHTIFRATQLKGIKIRIETLSHIPKQEWTLDDFEFMKQVQNSEMLQFFKQITK